MGLGAGWDGWPGGMEGRRYGEGGLIVKMKMDTLSLCGVEVCRCWLFLLARVAGAVEIGRFRFCGHRMLNVVVLEVSTVNQSR